MALELGLNRIRGCAGALIMCSVSLLSIWALSLSYPTPPPPPPCVGLDGILSPPLPGKPHPNHLQEQVPEIMVVGGRRELRTSGLGSSPPRCNSKCGKCTPCKPVHVPVPPGTPVAAEYYPEAWRCKCGNKLFMPRSYPFLHLPRLLLAGVIYSFTLTFHRMYFRASSPDVYCEA